MPMLCEPNQKRITCFPLVHFSKTFRQKYLNWIEINWCITNRPLLIASIATKYAKVHLAHKILYRFCSCYFLPINELLRMLNWKLHKFIRHTHHRNCGCKSKFTYSSPNPIAGVHFTFSTTHTLWFEWRTRRRKKP